MSRLLVRTSDLFKLVPIRELASSEREVLGDAVLKFGGVLIPKIPDAGGAIGVDKRSFTLLRWLKKEREASEVEAKMKGMRSVLSELVLRGFVEEQKKGRWECGPFARERISDLLARGASDHPLARISRKAIEAGIVHSQRDPLRLSARVYFYGRLPIPEASDRSSRSIEHMIRHREIRSGPWNVKLAQGYWYFRPRDVVPRKKTAPRYKLYFSPHSDVIEGELYSICHCLADEKPIPFKIGAGELGMARPDKLVAYFDSYEELMKVGKRLVRTFDSLSSHGVPFSSPLDARGVVSWGVDPSSSTVLQWQEKESWRLWVTNRIAASILFARASKLPLSEVERYCYARLESEGVDTFDWKPRQRLITRFGV